MNNPLVSVLIPFKNTEKFISDCFNSIAAQKYQNWEVLAVNDNSTDDSLKIANSYAEKDNRFKVYDNTGNGIIEALRLAHSKSNGKYITRMDADDVMTTYKLKVMVNALNKNGKGHLAIGKVSYFSDKGIGNGYARYEKWLNALTKKGINYSEIYKECVIPSPCWMVHREDLDMCGAFEPDRYPEDYDLAFRFYENGLKCIPCDEILHHWRDYENRTSRTSEHYAQNYFLDLKLYYFLKLEYIPERNLILWGAGNKGKSIAKALMEKNIDFYWVCDNPKKIGKSIYGKEMQHFNTCDKLGNSQTIVTVANQDAQKTIRGYFSRLNQAEMNDFFFFC
ncbi:glycosyltransferase family 2 protein [Costertonia aggregata]|uniref:Glycosyltransferase family 2 protein n=1 Tax=Costertonia aggregata TaxID=343403 RepID=A0A7H9AUN2_9FLAO|nr:glycosyltransferase family 2 protein [Costertonia aggregata]QLG47107.1 glycosyltransferase family 2 protein [Costertonia aggregata]